MKQTQLLTLATLLFTACTNQLSPDNIKKTSAHSNTMEDYTIDIPMPDNMKRPYAQSNTAGDYAIDISKLDSIFIKPTKIETGTTKQLTLSIPPKEMIPGYFVSDGLYVDTQWSITPKDREVTLNSQTGNLHVSKQAKHNQKYTISAKIKGREKPIIQKILVYSKTANPLIAAWHEESIQELIFTSDGKFSVTVMPFESYKDYWGTYTFDSKKQTLSLTLTGGNNKPDDTKIDDISYFFNKEGYLVLKNCYFGTLQPTFKKKNRYLFKP